MDKKATTRRFKRLPRNWKWYRDFKIVKRPLSPKIAAVTAGYGLIVINRDLSSARHKAVFGVLGHMPARFITVIWMKAVRARELRESRKVA